MSDKGNEGVRYELIGNADVNVSDSYLMHFDRFLDCRYEVTELFMVCK